ncbi:MAG: hypothetical protein MZV64_25610 [Ignavibacteriales bacterium]|nr:hypothetical protein [Ignavibacteriales bacterium]
MNRKNLITKKFEAEKAAAKKPANSAATAEVKAEVKPKVDTPPASSDNPGESKVS